MSNNIFNINVPEWEEPLNSLVGEVIDDALIKNTREFFHNLDAYLPHVPQVLSNKAYLGKEKLRNYASQGNWKPKSVEAVTDFVDDMYSAIFHTLEEEIVVGIDMEKEGYPSALFTRNIGWLRQLNLKGQIYDGDEVLTKAIGHLIGGKTEKAFMEAKFFAVRLEEVDNEDGKPIFKVAFPKSLMDIGLNKQFVIIPTRFYQIFEERLNRHFWNRPYEFNKQSVIGEVRGIATHNERFLRETYSAFDKELVDAKLRRIKAGYDITKQRFYAYDLTSSIYSLGLASFRPEMLNTLKPINISDIPTRMHGINFYYLRLVFRTRVSNATLPQLSALGLIDVNSFATNEARIEAVLDIGEGMRDKDLYTHMKLNEEFYGDIVEAVKSRERVAPKFLKQLKPIDLPSNTSERVAVIKKLLSEGLVSFVAVKKDGTIFSRMATNNDTVLSRMLGNDYVEHFESIRVKLYDVQGKIARGEVTSPKGYEELAIRYNITDYITPNFFKSKEQALEDIANAVLELKEASANRKISESMILYRNPMADNVRNFYGSFNANSLKSLEFAKV